MSSAIRYRSDIDGLRAIAVSVVVLFHAFPAKIRGGFVGVDIFFVISGYLITSILVSELQTQRFSIARFYERRIRRIFPALSLVILATCIAGWMVLLPDEFRRLGRHVVAGITFASNFAFWSESGYFDVAAEMKPTLHFWSLAIEEQFYLAWPLLLAVLPHRNRQLGLVAVALIAVSFAVNVALVQSGASIAAFYSPFARAWELLAGGLLALRAAQSDLRPSAAHLQSTAAAALLLTAIFVIDERSAFPGYWALLPVAGATLYISAGPQGWFNRLMSNRFAVWVGLISYPLYLWHWPVLSFQKIVGTSDNTRFSPLWAIGLAVVLAWATYEFVERRFRPDRAPARGIRPLIAGMAALLSFGAASYAAVVAPRNANPELEPLLAAVGDWEFPRNLTKLADHREYFAVGDRRDAITVFVGDSHVQQYSPRLVAISERSPPTNQNGVLVLTDGGCVPVPGVFDDAPIHVNCLRTRDFAAKQSMRPEVKAIVIGACWNCYFIQQAEQKVGRADEFDYYTLVNDTRHYFRSGDGVALALRSLETYLGELRGAGKRVFLLLDNPRGPDFDPRSYFSGTRTSALSVRRAPSTVPLDRRQAELRAKLRTIAEHAGAELIDPMETLCRENFCFAFEAGSPIYKDDNHLRPYFVRKNAGFLDRSLYPAEPGL